MLAALRGQLSVRQLQVMVDGLDLDRPLSRAVTGSRWLERDWLLHDLDSAVRILAGAYLTVNAKEGSGPVDLGLWPTPESDRGVEEIVDGPVDVEQAVAEAELRALMHREG